MRRREIILLGCCAAAVLFVRFNSDAQITLDIFAEGFNDPVAISNAGDSRLFIVEQSGLIRVIGSEGAVNAVPFLDISSIVKSVGNEQGLLGLAFHPQYTENGYFFVNYTDAGNGTVVSRFSVSQADSNRADAASESKILSFAQPYTNHNGGDLKFGPDGYLYVGTGDGGSAGDPQGNAQNRGSLLGKMLRIDVDEGSPYSIPPANPFVDSANVLDEIWSLGLRNPWRYSFDRNTGDLWIGDVGQKEIEEINFQSSESTGGENYGWRCYEGVDVYNSLNCSGSSNYIFPVHQYLHGNSNDCSVTGGYVYRGKACPELNGYYFFADYCSDRVGSLHKVDNEWVLTDYGYFTGNGFSTFGEDFEGEIYIAGLKSGKVYRIKGPEASSIVQYKESGQLQIYPNPFSDRLTLVTGLRDVQKSKLNTLTQPAVITLYDAWGQKIFESAARGKTVILELGFLSPGFYYVEVSIKDRREIKKLVKSD